MEKIVRNQKIVELENYFVGVWTSIFRIGKDIELKTDSKTSFVVKALVSQRKNGKSEEVLVFLKANSNGLLKECSRCYAADWGFYFNHLGTYGQRVGMYCKAIDSWVTRKALESEFD